MMDAEQVQNRSKVTPKRFKITDGEEEEEEEDRISLLPDCLILDILSRLPDTKQAIKTGTLSKRWQHLWRYVPNLIFHLYGNDNRPLNEFCSLVDKTLTQCRQLYLNKFQLYTRYDIQFQSQFNNWIHYAISCNVQELDMILASTLLNRFVLDQLFFTTSSFTHLRLGGCVFNPTGAISWNKLTSLCIQFAKIDGELIENILSGSPSLETLKLEHCYGYRRFDITSKSVKNLVLSGYKNREDVFQYMADIVEINAPNILSLTIEDEFYLSKLLLLDVSSLVKAFLDYSKDGLYYPTPEEAKEEMLKGFIQKLCQVKELTIGLNCVGTLSCLEAKGFNLPTNLKILDGDSEMIFEPSDSESSESGDLDEPLLDDFEVDESFDSDSDESGDSEEPLLDDSEADE